MHQPDVIYEYTDRQALEDGVLVAVPDGRVNRASRAVFDFFTASMASTLPAPVIDVTRLMAAIRSMLNLEANPDGWRIGTYEGKTLWLVPNEVDGLTLMFPEDY